MATMIQYTHNPTVALRDAVVTAANNFVGWEATAGKDGVAAVLGALGASTAARSQLTATQETNRLLRDLLVSTERFRYCPSAISMMLTYIDRGQLCTGRSPCCF